jgi:hypothetical protein
MPKRSNEFQSLIFHIESLLVGSDWTVTESMLVKDLEDGDDVEIDVAIQGSVGGHSFLIALECRDHSRKQGKEWVRELIGKYKSLPVDKVIAVSRGGFTASVETLARNNRITLLSPRQIDTLEWHSMFKDLQTMAVTVFELLYLRASVILSQERLNSKRVRQFDVSSATLVSSDGRTFGTVSALADILMKHKPVEAMLRKTANSGSDAGPGADIRCSVGPNGVSLDSAKIRESRLDRSVTIKGVLPIGSWVRTADGTEYPVLGVELRTKMRQIEADIPLSTASYQDAAVAYGTGMFSGWKLEPTWIQTPHGKSELGVWVEGQFPNGMSAELAVEYTESTGEHGKRTFHSQILPPSLSPSTNRDREARD